MRYHVQGEGGKIGSVFAFFWFATGLAINASMVAGLYVVEPVYHVWTHRRVEFDGALFGWLVGAVLVRTAASPDQTYLSSINHLRALFVTTLVRATLVLLGALAWAPHWGLAGVGAGVFVSEFVASGVIAPWFARRVMASLGFSFAAGTYCAAVGSTAVACAAVAAFSLELPGWRWAGAGALAVLSAIALWQWRALPEELHQRLRSLLRRAFSFAWKPANRGA
ncbi:MAG: hypothetical protein IPL39_10925 [Opitutaceae bacterium]|nr:hypothetical protein [Opitutaceae bacterium]